MHWTVALLVGVLGFAVWLLLDAPTLQQNARSSPVGTRRTVSLGILGPLASISRGLQVSHVVSAADGLIGRNNGNNGVHSTVISLGPKPHLHPESLGAARGHPATKSNPTGARSNPTGPKSNPIDRTGARIAGDPGPTTTTTAHAYQDPTASNPLRVLILGDSLGLDLGQSLVNDLANTQVVSATLDGKEATGLTRPDYFNWPAELQGDLPKYQPQVVVIMIGANDAQDFPGPPDIAFGSPQWNTMYTQRVQQFFQLATSTGAEVIWVGMPPMQSPSLNAGMQDIDSIDQSVISHAPNGYFLSSWNLLGGPQGTFTPYLTVNGQQVNVRDADGTHIAPGGAELLSQAVMSAMRTQLHIHLPG